MTSDPALGLDRFNALPPEEAADLLLEICASPAWASAVLGGRPFAARADLFEASDAALDLLSESDLAEAMSAHPPIGRPKEGDPVSAREQRGAASASEELKAELLDLNLRYQDRFGHVFLICATGLGAEQLRDALRERLDNTPERELRIVRRELGRINHIRLTRLAGPDTATRQDGADRPKDQGNGTADRAPEKPQQPEEAEAAEKQEPKAEKQAPKDGGE
ncbi:2-oxo-4-hydroxy-4-carboxy-5-ureidoimidazoline decarboxylase [Streptomyces physcomitrii]|uniref:2-oxo-4-hydroxy-4-carboxy-5-ureidoimidazoline decarboxylase n=1 Tax=Streptomyces physcomitrii TaxID=2724184 RepID=A0ABX1H7M8_9ACTN|nr:2-oxo-4-hydroxy-4-carboxy-5-ureidoimidazoline decarboxylase [Streptomyces physcomitrii]